MKSRCSFFFKALTAMVLVLLLLFGTVSTSLAAVVENLASSGATIGSSDMKLYYLDKNGWGSAALVHYGNDWSNYLTMTNISGTKIYYQSFTNSWGISGFRFAKTNVSSSGSDKGPDMSFDVQSTGWFFGYSNTYHTNFSSYPMNQFASVTNMVSSDGGNTYTDVASALVGTTIEGYKVDSGDTDKTAVNDATDGSAATATISAAYGSTVTITKDESHNAKFIGFYSETDDVNLPDDEKKYADTSGVYSYTSVGFTGQWEHPDNPACYAYYILPYTITYDKGAYGTGTIAPGSKQHDTAFTLSSSLFTRAGFVQDGWSTSDGGAKVYELGGSYTANSDITLYPHWVGACTITLDDASKMYLYDSGSTGNKTVTSHDSDGGTLSVTSSNTGVATVAIAGNTITVTPVAAGTATITVTCDARHGSTTFDVEVGSCALSFADASTATLKIGETVTRTATHSYNHNSDTITYSSDHSDIASVDSSTGEVTALTPGSATITATCSSTGATTATYNVSVTTPVISAFNYASSEDVQILVGRSTAVPTHTLNSSTYDTDNSTVVWSYALADGTTYATIDGSGVITANNNDSSLTPAHKEVTATATITNNEVSYAVSKTIHYSVYGYYLLGFNSWSTADTKLFKYDSTRSVWSTSASLTATTYTYNTDNGFKVVKSLNGNDTYYGNNGTYSRSADGNAWTFASDKNNAGITADVAGTYVFDLNIDTPSVTVHYPHTLTYHKNGHGAADPAAHQYNYYETVTDTSTWTIGDDSGDGYTFGGWYNEEGCTSEYEFGVPFTAHDDAYAKWIPKAQTVNLHKGSRTSASSNYSDDANLSAAADYSPAAVTGTVVTVTAVDNIAGYKFTGFYGSYTNGAAALNDGDSDNNVLTYTFSVPNAVTDIYVCYEKGATVTFNKGSHGSFTGADADKSSVSQFIYYGNNPSTSAPAINPAAGYIHTGWSPAITAVGLQSTYTYTATYAEKQATLVFNTNGATSNGTQTITANSGKAKYGEEMPTISTYTRPTKTGYTLTGWFDASSGGNKYYNADGTVAQKNDASVTWDKDTEANTTLYAQWDEDLVNDNATVRATTNGSAGADGTGGNVSASDFEGEIVDLSTFGVFTFQTVSASAKSGYTFEGWTVSGAAASHIRIKDSTDSVVIYNGSGFTPGTAATAEIHVYTDGTITSASSVTITANFTENTHSITAVISPIDDPRDGGTITVNGGSPVDTTTVSGIGVTTYAQLTASAVTGYTFTGWEISGAKASDVELYTSTTFTEGNKYSSGATATVYVRIKGTATGVTSSKATVTAVFTEDTYTVTYAYGSPAASISGALPVAQTKNHFTNLTLSNTVLTRPGYTHDGWSTTDGGAKAYNLGDTGYDRNSNTTLYPHWTSDDPSGLTVYKGMSFYLDDNYSTAYLANNSNNKPLFYFSTAGDEAGSVVSSEVTGETPYGKDHVYYANVPSTSGYHYVKVTNAAGTIDSGWFPITSLEKNMITYSGGKFSGLAMPLETGETIYSGGYSNIYYDNTHSQWTINGTDKLYFVIGNSTTQKLIEMMPVENTLQLYYIPADADLDFDYTYFCFATAPDGSDVSCSGEYAPTDATHGILNVNTNISTFVDISDLSGATKSYIGVGLNSGSLSALDMLWITDTGVTGSHANEYLNRGVKLTVNGRATAKIAGFKATAVGINGVTENTDEDNDGTLNQVTTSKYGENQNATFNYARSTVVTVYGIEPANGYTVSSVTYSYNGGAAQTITPVDGEYSFVVPGGDDSNGTVNYQPVEVTVNLTRGNPDVMVLGLWKNGSTKAEANATWDTNVVTNSGRVMTHADTLDIDGDEVENDVDDLSDVYYIDIELPGSSYIFKPDDRAESDGAENGFKVYDTDTQTYYSIHGGDGDSHDNYFTGNADKQIYIRNKNARITTISQNLTGKYRFVYYVSGSEHHVAVYYPNVVTYKMNETGGVTPGSETSEQRAVTYGTAADNWTPTRAGYVFLGWYTDAACSDGNEYTFPAITSGTTLYAKWHSYDATATLKTKTNGEAAVNADPATTTFSGISAATLTASAPSGTVFAGWTVAGSMSNHVTLYQESTCENVYLSGTNTSPVYIKSDGSDGITAETLTVTAVYLSQNNVTVVSGANDASNNLTACNGSRASTSEGDWSKAFKFGDAVTLTFDGLSSNMGIASLVFAEGFGLDAEDYKISGHNVSFDMPDHAVTVTDISFKNLGYKVTIKDKDKVDVDNLAKGGAYALGDALDISIKGADDYAGSSVLDGITVASTSGTSVTVYNNGSDSFTYNNNTVNVAVTGNVAHITGTVCGNIVITPICSTRRTINITSIVVSDVYSGYTTFYKCTKDTNGTEGKGAQTFLANMYAYVYYTGIETDVAAYLTEIRDINAGDEGIADEVAELAHRKAKASEYGLTWDKDLNDGDGGFTSISAEVDSTHEGEETVYLIAEDVDGDYIKMFPAGSKIRLVVNDVDDPALGAPAGAKMLDSYMKLGWYTGTPNGPDFESDPLVSGFADAFTFTLDNSTFLYAVVTRDLYVGGYSDDGSWTAAGISWKNAAQMEFDKVNEIYYKEFEVTPSTDSGASNYYEFRLFDKEDTGNDNYWGTSNTALWYAAAHTISDVAEQLYGGGFSWTYSGGDSSLRARFYLQDAVKDKVESGEEEGTYKVRLYYKPATEEIYMIPVYKSTHKEIYLSNGRIDGVKRYGNLTVNNSTTFTSPVKTGNSTTLVHDSDVREDFEYCYIDTETTFTFTTTLWGTNKADVVVAGYVLYNLDTGVAQTVTPSPVAGTATTITVDEEFVDAVMFTGTAKINYNAFICPVYQLSDTYVGTPANNVKSFTVSVEASEVDHSLWGGLVAMYTFGSSNKDYNSSWPGQLMLPEGTQYTGVVYNKESDGLTGIVFDNYNAASSFIGEFADRFHYPTTVQTYDYLEPITLMGQGDEQMLTFALKQNNDGYHGFYYNATDTITYGPYRLDTTAGNTETVVGSPYTFYDDSQERILSIDEVYTFDYLTDVKGARINFYGENVTSSYGYYIVCVGDTDYKEGSTPKSTPYKPNNSYDGQYSVEWYVYRADGTFILHTLSDAMYAHDGQNSTPYIVDQLINSGLTTERDLKEKSIKISYEGPNTRGSTTRFSGQWYSISTVTRITVYAGVGMMTSDGKAIVPENPSSTATYGSVAIDVEAGTAHTSGNTTEGMLWEYLLSSDASSGKVTLTATIPSGSEFVGWYSYNENFDKYTKVTDGTEVDATHNSYTPKPNTDTQIFAMFKAQVTYVFKYNGRQGPMTYTVSGSAANPEWGEEAGLLNKTNRTTEVQNAITNMTSVNVFNKSVTFSTDPADWDNTTTPFQIIVNGTAPDTEYTLHVYGYYDGADELSELGYIRGDYNTHIDLVTEGLTNKPAGVSVGHMYPNGDDSKIFLGWKKYVEGTGVVGDFISTKHNFGFALTDDLSIAPVFDTEDSRVSEWKAYIDKNEINREMTDSGSGKLYNDTIVRFTYGSDSAKICNSGEGILETGVIILAQTAGVASGQSTAFTALASTAASAVEGEKVYETKLKAYLGALSSRTSAKMNSAYGEAYAFKITSPTLSRLNRADICHVLDYSKFFGGQYILASYYKDSSGYHVSECINHAYSIGKIYPTV